VKRQGVTAAAAAAAAEAIQLFARDPALMALQAWPKGWSASY